MAILSIRLGQALLFLTSITVLANYTESMDYGPCDPILGDNYNYLDEARKYARIVKYSDCILDINRSRLNSEYKGITRRLETWKSSNLTTASRQLKAYAKVSKDKLSVEHQTEKKALRTRFDSEYSELRANIVLLSRDEVKEKQTEFDARRNEAVKLLQAKQKEEQARLNKDIKESRLIMIQTINDLWQADNNNLAHQYSEKSDLMKRNYEELVNAPMNTPISKEAKNTHSPQAPSIGVVQNVEGEAWYVFKSGEKKPIKFGDPIYMGNRIETTDNGRVDIGFADQSSISANGSLLIDEYVFDPEQGKDKSNFSLLRSFFVFTSGLLGRNKVVEKKVETPLGELGIRG